MSRPPMGEAQPPHEGSRSIFPLADRSKAGPAIPDRSLKGDPEQVTQPMRGELDSMARIMASQVKRSGPLTSHVLGMRFDQLSPGTDFGAMSDDELTYLRGELERNGVSVDFVEGSYVCRKREEDEDDEDGVVVN